MNDTQNAVQEALAKIHSRPVAEREQLGKMIKCQVCGLRHRETQICKQVFAKRWIVLDGQKVYTDEELIAGQTSETESVTIQVPRSKVKGKRKNPHMSHRKLQYAQLVRELTPDEYTAEELYEAKKKAAKIMVERHGKRWRNW
jgi:hypothetical protein